MTHHPGALYIGLRQSSLEWQAELAAAADLGYAVHVASDTDLSHTGLPAARTTRFDWQPTVVGTAATLTSSLPAAPAIVTCWGDRYVGLTAHLAAAFGARGPGVAAAQICTDKVAQRRALEPAGLNPRWRSGTTLEALRDAATAIGAPAVFKLAHASGGRGIAHLDPAADLAALLSTTTLNYVSSTAFVVEEYVDGGEHSVAGVVVDGRPTVWAVADKQVTGFRTTATVVPSRLDPEAHAAVVAAAGSAVSAVGIRAGGFHVDLRLRGSDPVILEVGARLGGDLINSHLVPIASGGTLTPYRAVLHALASGRAPGAATWAAAAATVLVPVTDTPEATVARMREHPGAVAAVDWSTSVPRTVAVVARASDPAGIDALVTDLHAWVA